MSSLMQFNLTPDTIVFEAGGDYPASRQDKVYQVVDRSAGGKLHVETLGIQTRTRVLVFNLMSKTDYDALVNWFLNVVNAGEKDFEFTDEYGDVGTVKMMDDMIDFAETSLYRYSGTITLEYIA